MEFSVDQAKSIFDLIKAVSPYAYPLLISLVFPVLWILMKKLMGFSNTSNLHTTTQGGILRKFFVEVGRVISLSGDAADKVVFYICICLFFVGGIILKIGEHNEEIIRQKTLGLKHLYEESGYLFYDTKALIRIGYDESELNSIAYKYSDEFICSGNKIVCVDSSVKRKVFAINHVLLDAYIREKIKHNKIIYLDSLFQDDMIYDPMQKKDVELKNVKNFFSQDIVYTYLAAKYNRDKFNLDVLNNKTIIVFNK